MKRFTKPETLTPSSSYDGLPRQERLYRILAFVWLLAVASGLGYLMDYANRPGERGDPSETWPEESRVPHSKTKPTLVKRLRPSMRIARSIFRWFALGRRRRYGMIL